MGILCGILVFALAASLSYIIDLVGMNEKQREMIIHLRDQLEYYRSKEEE